MATGEEGGQDFIDHLILSEDDAAKLVLKGSDQGGRLGQIHLSEFYIHLSEFYPAVPLTVWLIPRECKSLPFKHESMDSLSNEISAAVEQAAPSIVQVHGRRRVAAGLVASENIVITPAAVDDDKVAVRAGNGQALEGVVLGGVSGTWASPSCASTASGYDRSRLPMTRSPDNSLSPWAARGAAT